uniref:Uncharacterized protein n=1 Tax=Anopheles funestus TaxID=62324 RepID=A0A182S366_ANOFN
MGACVYVCVYMEFRLQHTLGHTVGSLPKQKPVPKWGKKDCAGWRCSTTQQPQSNMKHKNCNYLGFFVCTLPTICQKGYTTKHPGNLARNQTKLEKFISQVWCTPFAVLPFSG